MNAREPAWGTQRAFQASLTSSTWVRAVCGLFAVAGATTFVYQMQTDPTRAWRAYLVNFLFFTGMGAGGVLFACALNMSSGRWGRNVKRTAEGLGTLLPASLLLFLFMIPGLGQILPWARVPYGPEWWLDLDFLVVRNVAGLALLSVLGVWVLSASLRTDYGFAAEHNLRFPWGGVFDRLLARNWKGLAKEEASAKKRLGFLCPLYAIVYALVLTIIGVDLIMSLKAHWYSTLIGAYYFVGSFYTSLAALLVAAIWIRRTRGLQEEIHSSHLHDLAKLTMAFGIVTGDFFYTQLFVIWYGNLPFETSFLIDRMHATPWRTLGLLVLFLCFVLPLLAMLRQDWKKRPGPMLVFGTAVLAAMWMERFLLVGPSLTGTRDILFGPPEALITLGFFGLMGFLFFSFMARVPPVALRDAVLDPMEESP